MKGTWKQRKLAEKIRTESKHIFWNKGFNGTWESLENDFDKLPEDYDWWIDAARDQGMANITTQQRAIGAAERVRRYLGYEYNTPVGSDY